MQDGDCRDDETAERARNRGRCVTEVWVLYGDCRDDEAAERARNRGRCVTEEYAGRRLPR